VIHLIDTFNNRRISSHRTIEAAIKADRKYQSQVKAANGQTSYIPTKYVEGGTSSTWRTEGKTVDSEDVFAASI